MSTLKDIRHRLGYSQQEMAVMLEVTRSYLSKIENLVRRLPAAMYNKLAAMERSMEAKEKESDAGWANSTAQEAEKAIRKFEDQIEIDKIRLQNKINNLEKMKINYACAKNKFNFICKQMQKFSTESDEYRHYEIELKINEKTLHSNSEIFQQIQQIEIECAQQNINYKKSQIALLKSSRLVKFKGSH